MLGFTDGESDGAIVLVVGLVDGDWVGCEVNDNRTWHVINRNAQDRDKK